MYNHRGKKESASEQGIEKCSMPDTSVITDFDDDDQDLAEKLGIGIYVIRNGLFSYTNNWLCHTLGHELEPPNLPKQQIAVSCC